MYKRKSILLLLAIIIMSTEHESTARDVGIDNLSKEDYKALRQVGFDPRALQTVRAETTSKFTVKSKSVLAYQSPDSVTIKRIQQRLKPLGYLTYPSTEPKDGTAVLTKDPNALSEAAKRKFATVRNAKTEAVNYNLDNDMIVKQLDVWDQMYGLKVVGAARDQVTVEFVTLPKDVLRFTREQLVPFCPDLEDYGIARLVADLKGTKRVGFWWD